MLEFHSINPGSTFPWRYLDTGEDAIFWRARDSEELWVGLGSVYESQDPDQCLERCSEIDDRELPFGPRCFGALAFDPAGPMEGEWSRFSARRFWIPRALLRWEGLRVDGISADNTAVDPQPDAPMRDDHVSARWSSEFDGKSWEKAVNHVCEMIGRGELRKAVLAKRYSVLTDHEKRASHILKHIHHRRPDSYLIGYRQNSSDMFFSMSPERLFRTSHRDIDVDSLAGTGQVGDETLRKAVKARSPLLNSAKDREEQQIVTDYICERLNRLCNNVRVSEEPTVRNFGSIMHLHSRVSGHLKRPVKLCEILFTLHPTPAVCGDPAETAKKLIAEHEPDARGLYAGAIGMFDADSAEFAAAIRSGLAHKDSYSLYVGAGIVQASEAEAESRECEAKLLESVNAFI